ncbi:MAG: ATP-binding protein [Gammaproteobacteria bacterium]|nr:ATP-binding protein [Gammaproteobacteria bacterium]
MNFLIRIFQVENIKTLNYRFYFANNYALIIGSFVHLCFIPIFYYLNISVLALYNVFSIFIFTLSFILNRKGFHTASTIPATLEILLHATLAIYFIGWESGFFYPLLAIIPLVFSNPATEKSHKIIIAILLAGFYLSLKYFANSHLPVVQLEKDVINNLYFMNSFFIIIGISTLVYYFSLASEITENKIDKERDKANLANQAKSIFLANMSHELRTPLNAIIGYSEMLKDDADELGNKQNAKDLSRITNAGNHLLILINSILDLTKIEAGRIELEYQSVNIRPLIDDVVSTVNPIIKKGNNNFVINCNDTIGSACIDQTRVKQILFNLLSNACKFTKDGTIELSIYKENKKQQEWLCFNVADTGIGIASHKIEELFKPFMQADISTTRLYGGTGLGLTIIKGFISLMDGLINIESTLGKGTTFTIKLPINQELCK